MATLKFESDIVINGTISKVGGTSSQFLKANGGIDSNSYLLSNYIPDWTVISNKPTTISGYGITDLGSILKAEYIWTTGLQEFILPNDYYQVLTVGVQGQNLHSSQYTITAPNKVTILDTLDVNDYITVVYGTANLSGVPYYTQAQVDALINENILGNLSVDISVGGLIEVNKTYRVDASGGDIVLILPESTNHSTINIKKVDSSDFSVFIESGGNLIDGEDRIELSSQYESVALKWNAETYDII